MKKIEKEGMLHAEEIHQKVIESRITTVELSQEEVSLVIQTLMYDRRLEEVHPTVLTLEGKPTRYIHYKVVPSSGGYVIPNYLTSVPCGLCPVRLQCTDDGEISPQKCVYMQTWLAMPWDQQQGGAEIGRAESMEW